MHEHCGYYIKYEASITLQEKKALYKFECEWVTS